MKGGSGREADNVSDEDMSAHLGSDWGRLDGGLWVGDGNEGRDDMDEKDEDRDNESSLHGSYVYMKSRILMIDTTLLFKLKLFFRDDSCELD